VAKIHKRWARGIISKYSTPNASPELYLIDFQVLNYFILLTYCLNTFYTMLILLFRDFLTMTKGTM